MGIDRRSFFAGGAIGAASFLAAENAAAAPSFVVAGLGRSVTEFGVELDTERDQTAVLQKALDEIVASGHPAFLPPGIYRTQNLEFPEGGELCGVQGKSFVQIEESWIFRAQQDHSTLSFSNLVLLGKGERHKLVIEALAGSRPPLIDAMGGRLIVQNCRIENTLGQAFRLQETSAKFLHVDMRRIAGNGIEAKNTADLAVSNCSLHDCSQSGIIFAAGKGGREGAIIAMTRVSQCGASGIQTAGRAIVTANIIDGCAGFGLMLGAANGNDHILASQNSVSNCRVGIGVAAQGDYIFATLNMISGAREGAIRALDGEKLVGPDLSQKSTESFRNLTVIGNVVL